MQDDRPTPARPRRLLKVLAWTAAGLVALLALAFGLVQLPQVQARVAAYAESALAGVPGLRLTLTGLSGVWPFSIRATRIALADATGVWLDARDFELLFDPWRLIRGQLAFPRIAFSSLSIERAPETGESPPEAPAPAPAAAPPGPGFSLAMLPHLRLGELSIPELAIGESLIGESMRMSVSVKAASRARVARVEALIQRLDDSGTTKLTATLSGRTPDLDLDLSIDEPDGGLWGGWFGMSADRPFKAALRGTGPLSAWPARLTAEGVGLWSFATDLTLSASLDLARPLEATTKGHYTLTEESLPAAALDVLGRDIPFSAEGRLADFVNLTILDSSFGFGLGRTRVRGTLKLDASLATDAIAEIELADPMKLVDGSGLALSGVGTVTAHATGPVDRLDVSAETDVARAAIAGIAVREAHVTASTFLADLWEKDVSSLYLHCGLAAKALDLPVPGLPAAPVAARLLVDTEGFERWELADIDLDSPLAKAKGNVGIGLDGSLAGRIAAELPDLARFSPAAGPAFAALRGRAGLELRVSAPPGGERQTLDVSGKIHDLAGLPGGVEALAPGPLALSGRLGVTPAGLELSGLNLKATGFAAAGSGRWVAKGGAFSARASLDLDDAAPAGELAGIALSGPLSVEAGVDGRPEDFGGTLTLASPRLGLENLAFDRLSLQAAFSGLPRAAAATVEASAGRGGRELALTGKLAYAPGTLRVTAGRLRTEGLELNADTDIDLATGLVGGTLRGRSRDLGSLGRAVGLALAGHGQLTAELIPEAGQSVSLRGQLADLAVAGTTIGRLDLEADLSEVRTAPTGRFSVVSGGLDLGPGEIERLKAGGQGSRGNWQLSLETAGSLGERFDLSSAAELALTPEGFDLTLDSLDGLYGERPLTLDGPVRLRADAAGVELGDFRLRLGNGRLSAEGRTGPASVDWRTELTELPLEIFSPWLGAPVHGAGNGRLAVSGPPQRPQAEMSLRLTGVSIATDDLEAAPPVTVEGKAEARDGFCTAEASLGGLGETPLQASARLPLDFSLRPFALGLRRHDPLSGRLGGEIGLKNLSALPFMDNRSLRGRASLDLTAAGSAASPGLSGSVVVENGHFEDYASGLILTKVAATVAARDDRLEIVSLTAEDGDKGRVEASGRLDLDPAAGFPFDLRAILRKARLLRTGLVTTVADGSVGWQGSLSASTIRGQLTLDPTEVEVPKRLPVEVTELNVTEINVAGEPGRVVREKKPKSFLAGVALDMNVDVPARFFVRGRGLDAEFAGSIQAQGTAAAPLVRGSLHTVRGRFVFLDRTFSLTEGLITFTGQTPPKPFLDVRAESATTDITARLHLTGPPDGFKLALESNPPLPEDEILARLLFGRSTSTLNPIQALQLASALAELAGRDTGPDILGTVRKALGVDRLDIQGGDGQTGASLTVGKYVREDVYIGLDQSLQSGEQDVTVEVELTPNLSLESRAGTASGAGIGINWKYDY